MTVSSVSSGGSPFTPRERQLWTPPERLSSADWADRYIYLPGDNPKPGRWRTDFMPHLREPLNAFTDPDVEEIILMTGAQVGKSRLLEIFAAFTICERPTNIITVLPRKQDIRNVSKTWFRGCETTRRRSKARAGSTRHLDLGRTTRATGACETDVTTPHSTTGAGARSITTNLARRCGDPCQREAAPPHPRSRIGDSAATHRARHSEARASANAANPLEERRSTALKSGRRPRVRLKSARTSAGG